MSLDDCELWSTTTLPRYGIRLWLPAVLSKKTFTFSSVLSDIRGCVSGLPYFTSYGYFPYLWLSKSKLYIQILQLDWLIVLVRNSSALDSLSQRTKKVIEFWGRIQTFICPLFIHSVCLWTGGSSSRWYVFKAHVQNCHLCFK